jgi:hypothetical protein
MKKAAIVLLLLLPLVMPAQVPGSLSGPTLGYVFDGSLQTLRPLLGVAGSATIGGPVDLGFAITQAVDLPDERHVIASPADGFYVVAIDMGANPPTSQPIKGASRSVSEISVSPHGTAAALTYREGQLVLLVTGLPTSPTITTEISTVGIAAPLRHVAVNDDTSALMLTFAEGERETVYRWNPTDGFRLVASTVAVGALAFVNSSDVVFADSGTDEVFLAHDVKRKSSVTFVAGSAGGISRPIGAGISSRNEILVANAGSGTVIAFDANGQMLRTQDCNCSVSGFYPLGAGVFRLTEKFNQTMYLLDGGGSENRIVFVPPVQ